MYLVEELVIRVWREDPIMLVCIEYGTVFVPEIRYCRRNGALGIACVPELAMGMRLCIRLGIAPIGIPLDANRCARWMGKAQETSFNLRQLEDLLERR